MKSPLSVSSGAGNGRDRLINANGGETIAAEVFDFDSDGLAPA